MPKLSGNNLDKFNKSCSTSHLEFNKIEFAFFWVLDDFYKIYKFQQLTKHYLRCMFQRKPLKVLDSLRVGPLFVDRTLETTWDSQLGPRAPAGGGPAKLRRTGGRDRPGAGRGWSTRSLGSISTEKSGAVVAPAGSCGGDGRCQPLCPLLRRARGRGKWMGGTSSS
jgi:hypothetical protein